MNPHSPSMILALSLTLPAIFLADECESPPSEGPPPSVSQVSVAAPGVLQLSIPAQSITQGAQIPYAAEGGDVVTEPEPPESPHRWVTRGGEVIGALVGPNDDLLWTFDTLEGPDLNLAWADDPAHYLITSSSDGRFAGGITPEAVSRKSKGEGFAHIAQDTRRVPLTHEVFLTLPIALESGHSYSVDFAEGAFEGGTLEAASLAFDERVSQSLAIHVSQVGFVPEATTKGAYVSTWTGPGGGLSYPSEMAFHVVDTGSQGTVYSGQGRLSLPGSEVEYSDVNTALADVYELPFGEVTQPGRYQVCVDDIGCSLPFVIGDDVWMDAFRTSARYLLHGRSGEDLETGSADYARPRDHHPEDPWVQVRLSTTPLMDTGNGLNGDDDGNFTALLEGLLPEGQTLGVEAWGGYHDAGDWDRRIQHLEASILLLDLVALFPETLGVMDLGIPGDGTLPQLVEEVRSHVDFYRRLQILDGEDAGAVRGGIEHDAHPRQGEASWQDTNLTIAYAPDPWASWLYGGTAASLAHWLNENGRGDLGTLYRQSAEAAMAWAEAEDLSAYVAGDSTSVRDARNFAAGALYRLTGEGIYHEAFRDTTVFENGAAIVFGQRHGAWAYARAKWDDVDETLRQNCIQAYVEEGDRQITAVAGTGFHWAKARGYFLGLGTFSTVIDSYLMGRAHALTGDDAYLEALELMVQTGSGANPLNLSYTTGVGANPVAQPLHVDSRMTDIPTPLGITVLGPIDESIPFVKRSLYHTLTFSSTYDPPVEEWPIMECYHDSYLDPLVTEFTVHQTIAPNLFAWGYLAGASARRGLGL